MRKTTVAAIQMGCGSDVKENIEKASELIREAAAQGAQVILPPELFERPYFCQERRYEYYGYARTPEENDAVIHMKKLAKELETVIPVSFYEAGDHRQMFNSVAVIDADGSVRGIYRKTHIPDDHYYQEKFYFTPGDTGFRAFKTRYGTIVINEVFQTNYPEDIHFQQLRNEHYEKLGKIITDSILQIEGRTYHLECQSSLDGRMVIRMFEYDFFDCTGTCGEKIMEYLKLSFHNHACCIFETTGNTVCQNITKQS